MKTEGLREALESLVTLLDGQTEPLHPISWLSELEAAKAALLAHGEALGDDERETLWRAIENGWEIEPREVFEREAPTNGFKYALVQAIHHIWKRCVVENPPDFRVRHGEDAPPALASADRSLPRGGEPLKEGDIELVADLCERYQMTSSFKARIVAALASARSAPEGARDEEYEPHAFEPWDSNQTDPHGPIWCARCDYHRDHAIHTPPAPAEAPREREDSRPHASGGLEMTLPAGLGGLRCSTCAGARWLCEAHPDRSWPHDDCAGPGLPCPACNQTEPPAMPEGWVSTVHRPA